MRGKSLTKINFFFSKQKMGHDGGQEVSVLASYSDDVSLNPTEDNNSSVKIVVGKTVNKQKIGRGWPIF